MSIIKRLMLALLILPFISLFSSPAFSDGSMLLERCQATVNEMEARERKIDFETGFFTGYCLAFVNAVVTTMQITLSDEENPFLRICVPENANGGQSVRIFLSFLKNNPNRLHENETALAMAAFGLAYTCDF